MNRLCYISRNYRFISDAGYKARMDYEDIISKMGGISIGLHRSFHFSMVRTFLLNLLGVIKCSLLLKKGDIFFLQYPTKKYFTFLCRVSHLKRAHNVVFIHDLGSFRRKRVTIEHEIKKLNHSDYIIAANDSMREWLKERGLSTPMNELGIHDFLTQIEPKDKVAEARIGENKSSEKGHRAELTIAYAGVIAPRKNSFLFQLCNNELPYNLAVYGDRNGYLSQINNPKVLNKGYIGSDDFIKSVSADFGLVWDGDSLDECSGNFGEYLKYNSPHKVSFYICAQLPIIIWSKAALASYIEKENIGILVDSLKDIPQKISALSPDMLMQMKKNVLRMREQITSGKHMEKALSEAINYFENLCG